MGHTALVSSCYAAFCSSTRTNTSSSCSLSPYCGTKGFDVAFSRSLHNEMVCENEQVDVVCMVPGQVSSNMCLEPVSMMVSSLCAHVCATERQCAACMRIYALIQLSRATQLTLSRPSGPHICRLGQVRRSLAALNVVDAPPGARHCPMEAARLGQCLHERGAQHAHDGHRA